MAWQQLTVTTDELSAPEVADYFSEIGAVSVTFMDAEDEPVYEPALGETKIWSNTQVIALFELDTDLTLIKESVKQQFIDTPFKHWTEQTIADQVWERAWMEFYQPMKFADRLWVCPTDQGKAEAGTVCLTLDPGLAFGTGTHPTTALCLEWLATQPLAGKTIIDYGCGSGILAIAALLLGAAQAYAIDIDPQALTATLDNAQKNGVQERLICLLPEHFTPVQADVVLANILAKPLVDMTAYLSQLLAPQGSLVLSGILAEQSEHVLAAYQGFVPLTSFQQKEDWVRLAGIKP
jgi:ribosomal protein L11 methyltransferase